MHKNRRAPGSRPVLCIYLYSGGTSPDSLPVSYGYRAVLSGLRRKPDVPVPSPSGLCFCLSGQCSPLSTASPGTVHGCLDGRTVCKDRKHTPYTGSGLCFLCNDWGAACVWGDAESAWVWVAAALNSYNHPFTAPMAMPSTSCLWNIINIITGGMIVIVMTAPSTPKFQLSPFNSVKATAMGMALS